MQKNPMLRIYLAALIVLFGMAGLVLRFYRILDDDSAAKASVRQGRYHLHIPLQTGTIYDRAFKPLNNTEEAVYAVINPTAETVLSVSDKLRYPERLQQDLRSVSPFVCELTEEVPENQNLILLHGRTDRAGVRTAQHLLGYRQNGAAVAGLEAACEAWLSACDSSADVVFSVSGRGAVLSGGEQKLELNGNPGGGIVTALNARVQRIAETALQAAKTQKGAAVVLDVHSGDILACASLPVYNPDELAQALHSEDAPFINRALSAYSVGSVFKLVTAAAALERDLPVSYLYECKGSYTLYGQRFRCHKLSGHGLLDMQQAMTVSCNPYFISLSELLSAEVLHDTAAALGFGQPLTLAPGMQSDSGTLPDVSALSVPAEKANFAFGQGKLTASPMQIAAMTACIANGGIYSEPRLLLGKTSDGKTVSDPEPAVQRRVLSSETAAALQKMMIAVLRDSEHSNAVPCNIYAAGKTSTAQTGRTGADGEELCHAWMTGFFPAYAPKYAVTVLIEDGGSGNDAAAPVFRRIIEETRRCLIK